MIGHISAAQVQAAYAQGIASYGETLTFSRGGTLTTYQGVCDHPSNVYLQQNFFDDNELVGLVQPLVAVYLDGSCSGTANPPQVLDTFTRDGRSLTVRKVGVWRVGSVVVLYLAMCD